MLYSSWNKGCNRQNFPSFGAKFYPFTPLTNQKIKIKIGKNTRRYYHFTHIHHKWQSDYVWFLRYGSRRMAFLSFWFVFSLLAPSEPRKSKYWKMKKAPQDIILQMCAINDSHTMYGSWDMEHEGWNFLSFWPFFILFLPP